MPVYFGNQKIKPLGISKIYYGNDLKYQKEEPITTGLKFTAKEGDATLAYTIKGTMVSANIEKSNDGAHWQSWDGTPTIVVQDSVIYVRNKTNTLSIDESSYLKFTMTGKFEASGNVMSMINYANLSTRCFYAMFEDCAGLLSAPELPATKLVESCYYKMFENCTGLLTAPELPAKTLAKGCYLCMFKGCSSLTASPELPATDLTMLRGCYEYMFMNCTSLTSASKISATVLATDCFYAMFEGCSSLKVREGGSGNLIFTCPSTTGLSSPTEDMFFGTGGEFRDTPRAGYSYYWYN